MNDEGRAAKPNQPLARCALRRRDGRIEPSTKRLSERDARLCAGRLRCCRARLGETTRFHGPGRVSVRIVDVRPLQTSEAGAA